MTYLVFNLIFICVIGLIIYLTRTWVFNRSMLWTLSALVVLTAIFDSLLINAGLFHYNLDKLIGLYIGAAPIEDFFYPLLAVIVVPAAWEYFKRNEDE